MGRSWEFEELEGTKCECSVPLQEQNHRTSLQTARPGVRVK
jgi:hypothetical protein